MRTLPKFMHIDEKFILHTGHPACIGKVEYLDGMLWVKMVKWFEQPMKYAISVDTLCQQMKDWHTATDLAFSPVPQP